MKKIFLLTLLQCIVTLAICGQTARTFVVKNSADGESELTVYLPEHPRADGMAIVGCPGGGYWALSMQNEGHNWAPFYNDNGIAYAVLKYRMPHGDRNIPLTDAYNAIKTMREHAEEWGINPYAIGIQGFSAGGHLASAVSTHAPLQARPDFSLLFYPVISMDQKIGHRGSSIHFLGDGLEDDALIREWSSDLAVRRHITPPALVLTANDDLTVPPVTNGIAYYSAMRKKGNDCSLMVWPTGGHGFGFKPTFKYHEQMKAEILTWLNNLKLAKRGDVKIACVGNSITDGSGIDMADIYGYPAVLQTLLGDGYTVKNLGVSGRTMMHSSLTPYMKERAWRDCVEWNPDVVVVKLGTNDSKEHLRGNIPTHFVDDMQAMIDTLKQLPSKPRIILCSPIPVVKGSWTINDSVIVNVEMPIIKKMAKKNKCDYLDLHTLMLDSPADFMSDDGVHPTAKGARRMAELVADEIKKSKK